MASIFPLTLHKFFHGRIYIHLSPHEIVDTAFVICLKAFLYEKTIYKTQINLISFASHSSFIVQQKTDIERIEAKLNWVHVKKELKGFFRGKIKRKANGTHLRVL